MQRSAPVTAEATRSAAGPVRPEERVKRGGETAFIDGIGAVGYADVPLQAITARAKHESEDEPPTQQGPVEIIPKENDESRSVPASFTTPGTHTIATILRKGRPPETVMGSHTSPPGNAHYQTVAPSGAPSTTAVKNSCIPADCTVSFDAVSADANNWRVDVQSLTLNGVVNVKPWPSNPTSAATPNTANPVDGGNITAANFQSVIDDMADYNTASGGAGPDWHSTDASSAHEWAHWNTDWIADSVNSKKGGNWSKVNGQLDAIKEPKSRSADAAAAKTALQGRVDTRLATFNSAATTRWNAIPDSPGVAGSTGYVAGAGMLATLISSVRTYATTKGWTGTPPAGP